MKLFTKVMAAALLSTAISGAVMAATDFSDAGVLANDAKSGAALAKVKAASTDGTNFEITLDAGFVDSLVVLDTSRFTKAPTKNLMDGIKGLYTDLVASAGDAGKLKGKLATATVAKLTLDLTQANADYKNAVNTLELKRLADAVVDDPFLAVAGAPEAAWLTALAGKKSFTRPTEGSTTYATVEDAAKAFATAKGAKDATAGQAVLEELKKMRITDHTGAKHALADVVAFEAKADYTTADVRKAKTDKASRVGLTPAQQVSVDAFARLLTAVEGGHFAPLAGLNPTLAGDFDDALTAIAGDKGKAEALVDVLVAFAKDQRTLLNQKSLLEQQVAALKGTSGGTSGGTSASSSGKGDDHGRGRSPSPVRGAVTRYPAEPVTADGYTADMVKRGLYSYDPSTGQVHEGSRLVHQENPLK